LYKYISHEAYMIIATPIVKKSTATQKDLLIPLYIMELTLKETLI